MIPSATTCVRSAISIPSSIITARRTSCSRRPISSPSAVLRPLDERSETVLFDVERDSRSTSSPTGSPTPAYLRVDTPASIRSITTTGQRITVGEVLIGLDRQLALVIRRADPRPADLDPPAAEVIDPRSWP